MKGRTLSDSERRTIAMAAVAIVVSLGYVKVVKPYQETLTDTRDQLVAERASLARERATVAASTQNPALIQAVDSIMETMKYRLFSGRDETGSAAELSSYVAAIARRNHVLVQNATTQPRLVSSTGVRTLRVRLRAESDLRGILEFLDALEHGDRLVRFEQLEIARPATTEESEVETLILTATINGYALGDPEPPATGRGAAPARGRVGGGTP